jgi:hypothetical protein
MDSRRVPCHDGAAEPSGRFHPASFYSLAAAFFCFGAAMATSCCARPLPRPDLRAPTQASASSGSAPVPGAWSAVVSVTAQAPPSLPSLEEALCGTTAGCRVESTEPLTFRTEIGHAALVRTALTPEAAASLDAWGAGWPDYWIVTLDDKGRVRSFQRLTEGFKQGEEHGDDLPSTFTLTLHPSKGTSSQATLQVREPSPGGTAWGRNGLVRFTWPDFRLVEWEYDAFHVINPALNSSQHWNWETGSGGSDYAHFAFRYVIPRIALDKAFTTAAWKNADFARCAGRLHAGNAEHLPGDRSSPHSLAAVLSLQGELFVELHQADSAPLSKGTRIEVCYAGDFLWSVPETHGIKPQCVAFSLDGALKSGSAYIQQAPDRLRYKVELPSEVESPAVRLMVRDPDRRQSLLSSRYKLGEVLTFPRERVSCELDHGSLVPRFAALDPRRTLIDHLQ